MLITGSLFTKKTRKATKLCALNGLPDTNTLLIIRIMGRILQLNEST